MLSALTSLDASFLENLPLTACVCLVVFVVGLCAGSLLSRMGDRIGHGESLLGRSRCDLCGHKIAPYDLIPIVSYLVLKGKCRHCGQPIGKREPLCELLVAGAYVTIVLRHGVGLETLELLLIASALVVISIADLYDYTVPNGAIVFMVGVRTLYLASVAMVGEDAALAPTLVIDSLVGALVVGIVGVAVGLLAPLIMGREAPAAGDIKLACVAGFCFGWQNAFITLVIACLIAVLVTLVWPRHILEVEDYDPDDFDYAPEDFSDAAQLLVDEAQTFSADQTFILTPEAIARAQQAQAAHQSAEAADRLSADMLVPALGAADEDLGSSMNVIPFGPSLALAFWIEILIGSPVIGWTMGLF